VDEFAAASSHVDVEFDVLEEIDFLEELLKTAQEPVSREAVSPSGFMVRRAMAAEAVDIAECALLTYGSTYEDYIYSPKRILELNESGELVSLVAITPDGLVLGHCALKFLSGRPWQAEAGVLFVRPGFRKGGVGAALCRCAIELGREMGLRNIYARSVTGHPVAQKLGEENGFQDCALLLGLFPKDVDLKSMEGRMSCRMSGVLQSLNLGMPRVRTIDPPARHGAMIAEIYRRAELPVELCAAASNSSSPVVNVRRIPVLDVALLEVETIGRDPGEVVHWIRSNLRDLCGEGLHACYLYLNLEELGAAAVADGCAAEGFILSGIAPDTFDSADALVLQYLNVSKDPFGTLRTWTDTARLLWEYSLAEWRQLEPGSGR
jgi:GNAT superfamily N-acetyltransferase